MRRIAAPRFVTWLAVGLAWIGALSPVQARGAPSEGQRLYALCATCHGDHGQGDPGQGAPNIGGLDAAYVERQLHAFGQGSRGSKAEDDYGLRMRAAAQALPEADRRKAVAAYVAALPLTPAPVSGSAAPKARLASGRNYFNAICSGCHNSSGMGSASLGAPRLAGTDPSYLMRQLAAFRSGARGADPADTYGAQMRRILQTLPGPATDRDIVAYAATLPTRAGAAPGAKP